MRRVFHNGLLMAITLLLLTIPYCEAFCQTRCSACRQPAIRVKALTASCHEMNMTGRHDCRDVEGHLSICNHCPMTRPPAAILQTGVELVWPLIRIQLEPASPSLLYPEISPRNHPPASTLFDPVLTSLRV